MTNAARLRSRDRWLTSGFWLLALAAAVAPRSSAHAADAPVVAARHVLEGAGFSTEGAVLTDLDDDGKPEIAVPLYNNAIAILDPAANYRVRDVYPFGSPASLKLFVGASVSAGLAHRLVAINEDDKVRVLEGQPLHAVEVAGQLPAVAGAVVHAVVGQVDADPSEELVLCSYFGVRIIDLTDGATLSTVDSPICDDLQLIQFDATPALEILVLGAGAAPRVYDGSGALLGVAPVAWGSGVRAANLDNDPASELLALTDGGTHVERIEPSQSWSHGTYYDGNSLGPNVVLQALDLNHDGRNERIAAISSGYGLLLDLADGDFKQALDPSFAFPPSVLIGNFDTDGAIEALCTSRAGSSPGPLVAELFTQHEDWVLPQVYGLPSTLAVGDVDGAPGAEVTLAQFTGAQNGGVKITQLDGATLARESVTALTNPAGVTYLEVRQMSSAQLDADPKADLIAGGNALKDGNGASIVMRVLPGSSTAAWTNAAENSGVVRSLLAVDRNGDGLDEIAALSASDPFVTNDCRVRLIGNAGNTLWDVPLAAPFFADGDVSLAAVQVDGAGDVDVIVACHGNVYALRGEDGAPLWLSPYAAIATQLVIGQGVGGSEVWAVSPTGVRRAAATTGTPIDTLPGTAFALVPSDDVRDVLIRRGAEVLRLNLTTGMPASPSAPVGESFPYAYGSLRSASTGQVDTIDVYVGSIYGVERVRASRYGVIFQDDFE